MITEAIWQPVSVPAGPDTTLSPCIVGPWEVHDPFFDSLALEAFARVLECQDVG